MRIEFIIIFALLGLLYLKWVVMLLVFPFQVIYFRLRRKYPGMQSAPFWARCVCLPYKWWEKLFRKGWQRYMLYHIGLIPSHHLRRWVYRALGAEIGKDAVFHFRTEIRGIHKLKVGAGTIIGDNALLAAQRGLSIGKNVNISSNVSIYSGEHDYRDPYFRSTAEKTRPVVIGDRVWIGSNVIILTGVNIGEGAVCCAGCVVTKDVAPYDVVAGIPARKVGERPRDLRYEFKGKTYRLL